MQTSRPSPSPNLSPPLLSQPCPCHQPHRLASPRGAAVAPSPPPPTVYGLVLAASAVTATFPPPSSAADLVPATPPFRYRPEPLQWFAAPRSSEAPSSYCSSGEPRVRQVNPVHYPNAMADEQTSAHLMTHEKLANIRANSADSGKTGRESKLNSSV